MINALSGGMEMIWGMRTELSGISLNQMGMKDSGERRGSFVPGKD